MTSISAVGYLGIPRLAPPTPSVPRDSEPSSSRRYGESACSNTVHGRIHQVHALSRRLKCFSSSEVLLAILLADLDDLTKQRTVDPSGLSYLSGIVLAGMIARQVGTIPVSNYRPIPSEKIPPVGTRFDVRV